MQMKGATFIFFAHQSLIFNLFCALKTLLSKLENLWYLRSKQVNFDAQKWLWCTIKIKNHPIIKMNIARFVRNIVKWYISSNFQTFDIYTMNKNKLSSLGSHGWKLMWHHSGLKLPKSLIFNNTSKATFIFFRLSIVDFLTFFVHRSHF